MTAFPAKFQSIFVNMGVNSGMLVAEGQHKMNETLKLEQTLILPKFQYGHVLHWI